MPARIYVSWLVCLALQGDTFAADQSLVRLDIHATLDGAPVLDLKASDLSLIEDGVPQRIDELTHVSTASRSFVVFLDTPHMRFESARDVRVPLGTFLDRLIDDDDLVALTTPDAAAADLAFTTKADVISGPLQDETTWERTRIGSRDPKEDRYAQCFPANQYRDVASEMQERHREQTTLDAIDRLIARLSGRGERTAVILVTDGWRLAGPNFRLAQAGSGGRRGDGGFGGRGGPGGFPPGIGGQGGGARRVHEASSAECDTDRVTLAAADHARRLDRLADAANRGMVSFYAVYARGLVQEPSRGGRPAAADEMERDPASRIDSMRQLSANTSGLAVMTSAGLESALTRIAADMGAYDALTYRSSNTSLDGRFRAVTVRSLRPGIVVRTRRGYRGATVDDVIGLGGEAAIAVGSAIGTLAAVSPRTVLRVRTAAARVGDSAGATLWVVGELDYRARRELAWTAGAIADITVVASSGREVALRTIDVPVADAFKVQVPDGGGLEPGEYAVRVRLRPISDGSLPVIDTSRVIVPNAMPATGEGLLWRRGPSTGPRFALTADPRFTRAERIRVEQPTRATAPATARMLDRLGNPNQVPVQTSERVDETGLRWIAADAVLAALAPGDYAIETTVDGITLVTAFQLVP